MTSAWPKAAGLAAACAGAVLVRLWIGPHVLDDAYITFRYSARIAAGLGFTYNDSQHVLGTTTPLLAMLLAAASRAGLSMPGVALTISMTSDVVSILLGAAILSRAGWTRAAMLFAVLMAAWPVFVAYSVSGLETSTYVMLLLAAVYLVERDHPIVLGLVLTGLVLCRIDGALMSAVCAIAIRRKPTALVTYATAAAAIAPWLIFSLWYFHSIVPASVQAKVHLRSTVGTSATIFRHFFSTGVYLPLSAFAMAGVIAIARGHSIALRAGLLWWLAYAVVFIVTGAFGPFPWYFVPLLPLYFMALAITAEMMLRLCAPRLRAAAHASLLAIVIALLAWRLTVHRRTMEEWGEREAAYRDVAERVLDRSDCLLAATEIGTLGYFYRGPILDLMGLVSPQSVGRPMGESIASARPCWVVAYSDLLSTAPPPAAYRVRYARRFNEERTLLVFERR